MKTFIYQPANIHEIDANNYAVCNWVERAAQYQRPLSKTESRLTGCSSEYARTLSYFGGFTRKQAYSRATLLYGYAKIQR